MRKIIASDYDGTLRRPNKGIIDKDRDAIKEWRKSGNLFGVVTGRGSGFERELENENVEYDFIIDFNGTEIWNNKSELLKRTIGRGDKLFEMLEILLCKEGDWADIITTERSYYVTYKDKEIEVRDTWVKNIEIKKVKDFLQIYALRTTDSDSLETAKQINEQFGDYASALVNGNWLNIAPEGVTKATGIADYATIMGVKEENIYSIGDSYNDLDMLKAFKGYSVMNGSDEVKKFATGICDGIWALTKIAGIK